MGHEREVKGDSRIKSEQLGKLWCHFLQWAMWGKTKFRKENKSSEFRHVKFEMTEKARRIEFRVYNKQAGKQKMVDQCITMYYKV